MVDGAAQNRIADGFIFEQVDRTLEYFLQSGFELDEVVEIAEQIHIVERDQHVDIAVRPHIVPGCGTENIQRPYAVLFAKLRELREFVCNNPVHNSCSYNTKIQKWINFVP